MASQSDIVETASEAAEDAVFAEYDRSAIADFDVTARLEDAEFTIDVYLDAGAEGAAAEEREREVAEAAADAAREAADAMIEED